MLNPEPAITIQKDALVAPRSVPFEEIQVDYPEPIPRLTASSTQEEVGIYIAERGEEIGLSGHDIDVALSIVWSESQFRNVCNAKFGCVAGMGIFQFIKSTWKKSCEGEIMNPLDNVECGLELIKQKQFGHWAPYSVSYWKRLPMTRQKLGGYNWE